LVYLLILMLWAGGCGKDKPQSQDSDPNDDTPIVVDSGETTVFGVITIDGEAVENLMVTALDLTSGSKNSALTDKTGTWRFQTSQFVLDHDYSFHVLSADQVLLAILDFSDTSGLQGAVSFNGGYGMALGSIDFPVDTFGLVDLATLRATPPRVSPAGGFSVELGKSGTIDEVALPSFIDGEKSGFGHSLMCSSETDILNGFYLKSANTAIYQQVLNACSGFFLRYTPATDMSLKQLWAAIPSPWMQLARKKKDMFSRETSAVPWETTKRFLQPENGIITGDFTLPKTPCFGCGMDIYLTETTTNVPVLLTQGISERLTMIPQVIAASKGGTTYPIAYANASQRNGLNRPFSLGSDSSPLILSVSRPILESQLPPSQSRWVFIKPTYFLTGVEVTPAAADFSAPYNEDYTNGAYQWSVNSRLLTYELSDGVNPDSLSIPDELFLRNRTDSDSVKLQIIYETKTTKSGTLVRFNK